MTLCSREAEVLRERGLRRRSERGTRSRQGEDPRWAELAGGGGAARRAEGTPRSVRVCCICMAWRRRVVAGVVPRRVALDGVGGFFVRADGERERGGVAVEPRRITATGGTWLCVPPRKPRRPAKAAVEKDEKVEGKSAYFSLFFSLLQYKLRNVLAVYHVFM